MNRLQNFARDDENDTRLFDKLEEYVLEHYPNPQRIGCLDHDTLITFVEIPEKLDLADPKYLHIFKCAECTRDLRELRRVREDRLQQKITSSTTPSDTGRQTIRKWRQRLAAAVAFLCASAIRLAARLKFHSTGLAGEARAEAAIAITIDLSDEPSAGPEPGSLEHHASLPRRLIDLHLVLPSGSPAGIYRIAVARERAMRRVQADGVASANVHETKTELQVMLDLRALRPGGHFLGIGREDDRVSRSYPLLLD